ncbi:MAG: tRNA threonylcarbamoyladenosine dehydratase [Bacteroidales bacterium]|nr:tRNA threonylcarbamoyladenosine dehydratase [Bacteroidales bacterium]
MNTDGWNSRTEQLIGPEKIVLLRSKHVLVAGLGGVGAYAAEMLGRAGIGKLTIIDGDLVATGNRNRQLLALKSTEGKPKAELMAQRLRDINPDVELIVVQEYLKNERIDAILDNKYDYVVDAIDTLSPKVFFIIEALKNNLKLVSSMGAGGKFNPALIEADDISKTHGCKLAFYIRKRLQKFGIRSGFTAVFSPEPVDKERKILVEGEQNKKSTVGTISYMPAVFGCFCASVVLRELIREK